MWIGYILFSIFLILDIYIFPMPKWTEPKGYCLGCCTYECWLEAIKREKIFQWIIPFYLSFLFILILSMSIDEIKDHKKNKILSP